MSSHLWSCNRKEWLHWKKKYELNLALRSDDLPPLQTKLQKIKNYSIKKGFITTAQLGKLMKFQLLRGKWRPGLQGQIVANPNNRTKKCTKEAFIMLGDARPASLEVVKVAIQLLVSELEGVGPSTASLILSLRNSEVPFLSDAAFEATGMGTSSDDLNEYLKFVEKIWQKCDMLSHDELRPADMVDILWCRNFNDHPQRRESKKRKRQASSQSGSEKRNKRRNLEKEGILLAHREN